MRVRNYKISYAISLFLAFVLVYFLPGLPPVGIETKKSLFTTVWLFFALLVLASHLKVIFAPKRELKSSKVKFNKDRKFEAKYRKTHKSN